MIFTETLEYVCKSGSEYGVEVVVDQFTEYLTDNGEAQTFTDIMSYKIFDHFGDEVTEEMDSDDKEEIEEHIANTEFNNEVDF